MFQSFCTTNASKVLLIALFLLLFIHPWCIAQTDDCMAAPELIVVADCSRSPGNTKGLIENAQPNTCGGNADDDGWFKFTAISERTQISVSTDQLTDMVIGVYQNCAVELGCVNDKGVGGQEILRLDTNIGEVYYIQIYEAGAGGAAFLICVSALDPIICTKPTAINFDIRSPNCNNPNTGSIEITAIDGGIASYTYQLDENEFKENPIFTGLSVGPYQIVLEDTLGCQFDTIIAIIDTVSFTLDIGEDLIADQGDFVNITALTNIPSTQIDAITWSGIPLEDCPTSCQAISFLANQSTTIQASIKTLDGCQISDELRLTVPVETKVYIPNIFSPNGDGINDRFIIYTNENISNILSLKIADRWGNLVFRANNFTPNQPSLGWDGRLNNQLLSSQTFIYFMEIRMPNEKIKVFSGELFLVL